MSHAELNGKQMAQFGLLEPQHSTVPKHRTFDRRYSCTVHTESINLGNSLRLRHTR
jgi:hypothetical protein